MAIQRDGQAVNFGTPQPVAVQGAQVGFVNPDVNKFYDPNSLIKTGSDNGMMNLLKTITKSTETLASTEMTVSQERAYLDGASAAGAGIAEQSVQSNIFTKDWATAGYRDTRGRLAQADAESDTAVDMAKLREQSPAKFQEYLQQRRDKVLANQDGMSLQARQAMATQQLTSDRAAIAKHAIEHQKFIIDQQQKAVSTDTSVKFDAMDAAKTDPAAYLLATDNAYAGILGNIWMNPNMPVEARLKLTGEAATAALARNHQALYEKMRDSRVTVTNVDGTTSKISMLNQLPFDEQTKLAKAYKSSLDDTKAVRTADFNTQMGLMQADMNNPNKPSMSFEDLNAFLAKGEQLGVDVDRRSTTKQWAEAAEKKAISSTLGSAWAAGDSGTLFKLQKSQGEGYDAYVHTMARAGVPQDQVVANLLDVGTRTGQESAFKGVGEMTKSAVAQLGTVADVNPQNAMMLNTVLTKLDTAQRGGNNTAMSAYLSSFNDADRAKLMYFREGLQDGKAPAAAAAYAADQSLKTSQLSDSEKNALAANHVKANAAILADMTPRGLWGAIKNAMPDVFRGQANIDKDKITPDHELFENDERYGQGFASSKAAMIEELNYVDRSQPYASDESRAKLAYAAVAARTIVTGPNQGDRLVIPRLPSGSSVQDYFGVSKSVRPETIGDTLADLHKPAPGNRVVYKAIGTGQLAWSEYGPKGELTNAGGVFDPKSVAGAVQEKFDSISERFNRTDGRGVTVQGSTGVNVTFNGNNTVGIDTAKMLSFRENLVKHEDVRDTPYEDSSGKIVDGKRVRTAGVGVSSHNPYWVEPGADGKLTPTQINDSFTRASNAAAQAGRDLQQRIGLNGDAAFKLLSELSYQSGIKFSGTKANAPFIDALKEKDKDAAVKAFKSTPAYIMSHESRRNSYLSLINQALEK